MSSSVGNNGIAEPEAKRRRILDAGGPIEDDETARQKMREARVYEKGVDGTYDEYVGFDPDNVADVKSFRPKMTKYQVGVTPMGYFARDLPMMRWLYVNGADTRDVDVPIHFPMHRAAERGHLEVCKWLFDRGAAKDVKRGTRDDATRNYPDGRSPLYTAFTRGSPKQHLSRWLMLNGALCKDDDSGDLDIEIMRRDLGGAYPWLAKGRKALLEWANDLHRARTSFLLFLSGALSWPKHACNTRRTVSPLRLMAGKSGIFETIGDYVGIVCGREARIIRQLTEMLPKLIAELQVDTDSSNKSSSDE